MPAGARITWGDDRAASTAARRDAECRGAGAGGCRSRFSWRRVAELRSYRLARSRRRVARVVRHTRGGWLPPVLVAFVIGGQWALHTAFGAMAHGSAATEAAHHAATTAAMPAAHALSPSMAAAHTAAAALVALWLAAGERLLFVMLDAATARPLRALRPVLVPAPATPSVTARETSSVLVLRRRLVGVALSWRGPPASVCFR